MKIDLIKGLSDAVKEAGQHNTEAVEKLCKTIGQCNTDRIHNALGKRKNGTPPALFQIH